MSAANPARYYAASDGHITVWRMTRTQFYRSVTITAFGIRFRQCRPSGEPNSYPTVPLTKTQYRALTEARGASVDHRRGSWIDNIALPPGIAELLSITQGGKL